MGRHVRRLKTILVATALEILSEPLSLLILLSAFVLAVLTPAFHYHQFGEATRMARDAGLSALFTCGSAVAIFGTIRTFRREIETGTLAMTLAHPVSRSLFFLAKTVGAILALFIFDLTVFGAAVVVVAGAAVGGEIAAKTGDVARLWGPAFAAGVGVIVVPLAAAAALNRFARVRFVLSATLLALGLSVLSAAGAAVLEPKWVLRFLSAALPVLVLSSVYLAAAAAFAVRFAASAAASAAGLVVAASLPVVGNYYLADALSHGGCVPVSYLLFALLAAVPALALFVLLGIHFANGRDIS